MMGTTRNKTKNEEEKLNTGRDTGTVEIYLEFRKPGVQTVAAFCEFTFCLKILFLGSWLPDLIQSYFPLLQEQGATGVR
jgi:hypothetical protein